MPDHPIADEPDEPSYPQSSAASFRAWIVCDLSAAFALVGIIAGVIAGVV